MNFFLLIIGWTAIFLKFGPNVHCYMICDRTPEGVTGPKSKSDNRFSVEIKGDYKTYKPGEMYTISLAGISKGNIGQAKFTKFSLTIETTSRNGQKPGTLFLLGDALTKFSEDCANTIIHTAPTLKTEAQVLWSAPPQGTGCVIFKATVVEHDNIWYQDDGPLSKQICEDLQQSRDEQPEVNRQCCACDEAKYEISFEGLWSRHTHPKDFPENLPTRFSDVIGASHTTDYRFWNYGGKSSDGLKEVAELGSTKLLESELKSQSENIRTIIKARGISYPNATTKTFAVFRVDSQNHLISLVSMIDPSPDWVVGVSGLELCLANCSWIDSITLNLYPWDVGTDSGITYTSPNSPTDPRDHIRRITSSFPSDPKSPFYDSSGAEMKPLGRLYLTRQRLYEKSCSDEHGDFNNNNACEVGEWSQWSTCSASCGSGKRTRQRFYIDEMRASMANCNRELTSRAICEAQLPCSGEDMIKGDDWMSGKSICSMTEWSEWSRCSVTCGKGVRHRFRNLEHRRNWKKCMAVPNPPIVRQDDICVGALGIECQESEDPNALPLKNKCDILPWSEWSSCSVTCGAGSRSRFREIASKPNGKSNTCPDIKTTDVIPCTEIRSCEITSEIAKEICQLPKMPGSCRGRFEKWFYNPSTFACEQFIFTGCMGNRNQFDTADECNKACKVLKEEWTRNRTFRLGENSSENEDGLAGLFAGIKSESHIRNDKNQVSVGVEGPVIDCKVSNWSSWSECSVSCGRGMRQKSRQIITSTRNGGRACPRKLLRRKPCNSGPCTTGFMSDEEKYIPDDYDDSYQDECVYSEWSSWSQCTETCGFNSIQERTRTSIEKTRRGQCGKRFETRLCNVFPCETIQ